MANLAPVTNANRTTNINVVINNNGDSAKASATADTSDRDAVAMAKEMQSVAERAAQRMIDKNRRFGGSLSSSQRR
jgi:hypothetical protein